MTGTLLKLPEVNASVIDCLRKKPSTVGASTPPVCLARIVATGRARRQVADWSAQPAAVAKFDPEDSAAASEGWVGWYAPDSTIALSNSPAASGEASCVCTDRPPADSPKMVTLCGFPPKWRMLRCTHSIAACWLSRP